MYGFSPALLFFVKIFPGFFPLIFWLQNATYGVNFRALGFNPSTRSGLPFYKECLITHGLMKIFAKSKTISLIVGLILMILILPGAVSAAAGSPPVAQFTASTTSGNAPMTVQFTDMTGSQGTTVYKWDMNNDGVTDYSTKDPAHTFTVAGTYTIKLTVINAYGVDTETKTNFITISPPGTKSTPVPTPVLTPEPTPTPQRMPEPTPPQVVPPAGAPKAQFTSSTTQGKSPLSVTFTDQSTGTAPMTYRWDFSDGAGNLPENSQQNPTWRFWENVATSYTVRLTVTNAYGSDTIVKQNYITLGTSGQPAATPAPTPRPTAPPAPIPTATPTPAPTPIVVSGGEINAQFTASTTSGNAPLTVQFTDLTGSTGTTVYKWDVNNDGRTDYTTKDPAHTFTAAGTYTIKLTVINSQWN